MKVQKDVEPTKQKDENQPSLFDEEELKPSPAKYKSYDEIMDKKLKGKQCKTNK